MKTMMILLTTLISLQASAFCIVNSELNQEINPGITADTVCNDAASALYEKFGPDYVLSNLNLSVTFETSGQVGIFFQALSVNGDLQEGSGYEYWYPGYSFFQIF